MRSHRGQGSIVLVSVIILLLVSALGIIGWRMLEGQNAEGQASTTSTQTSAEVILTHDDLDVAEKSLDELNFLDENAATAEQQADL